MTLKSMLSASALIAIGMVLGRALGLLREMMIAAQFGASTVADRAILLLIIPDFITASLIGSAAGAALVPAFASRTPAAARALFRQSLTLTLAIFCALALILFAATYFSTAAIPSSAWALTLLALPLSAATAIFTAWLQFQNRFLVPAFATVIFNSTLLIGLWLLPSSLPMLASIIATAAAVRLAAHIFIPKKIHHTSAPSHEWQLDKPLRTTYFTAMLTGLLGLLPTYIPYVLLAASGAGVAVFNYALKLVLMPTLLTQTMAHLVLLPWLVNARKTYDATTLATRHCQIVQACVVVSFVLAMSLALCAHAITTLCFAYGKITAEDVAMIAENVSLGIFAMPAMLLTTLTQSMLYAAKNARVAFIASLWQAAFLAALSALALIADIQPIHAMCIFIATQYLPLCWLLPACIRLSLLPPLPPKKNILNRANCHLILSCAIYIICFTPLSLWLTHQTFAPIITIACACAIGIVSLSASALTYRLSTKKIS